MGMMDRMNDGQHRRKTTFRKCSPLVREEKHIFEIVAQDQWWFKADNFGKLEMPHGNQWMKKWYSVLAVC